MWRFQGVYPDKEAVAVTRFDPVTYGGLLAKLAVTPKGKSRIVQNVILVVNPSDYFTKVMPGTTIMSPAGTYVNNVLPYPTTVIQSVRVPATEQSWDWEKNTLWELEQLNPEKLSIPTSITSWKTKEFI